MDNVEKLLELGAVSVAGDLLLNGKIVAQARDGELTLTEDGKAVLESITADQVAEPAKGRRTRIPKLDVDDLV